MHTRNTMRNWAIASAVAAMMATATSGAFAQDATSTTPMAPAMPGNNSPMPTTPGTPMSSTAAMPMSNDMPMNMPTDYWVLNNRIFDSVDLQQSRARGLSDNQIATIVKISKKTGLSYRYVSRAVERGETFPEIATTYNLRLSDVYSNDKEKQEIADYTSLSEAAASLGKGNGMMSMPMDNSTAPMTQPMDNSTAPMAPTTQPMDTTSSTPAMSNSATMDIVQTAMAAKNLSTFVKAVQIAGLEETLKGSGPFTVFAPNNQAFSKLPAGALDALEADPAKLKQVLTYHVIPASIMASDAAAMTTPTSPPTVEGATLQVTKGRRGRLMVNGANVVKADIQASNGVIHVINQVLMPPMDANAPMDTTTTPAAPAPTDMTPPTAPVPDTTTPAPAAPGAPGQ